MVRKKFIAYEQEIKRFRDENAVLAQKLDDAKEEGRKAEKSEVAKAMFADTMDATTIARLTRLSIDCFFYKTSRKLNKMGFYN